MIKDAQKCYNLLDESARKRLSTFVVLVVIASVLESIGAASIFLLVKTITDPESIYEIFVIGSMYRDFGWEGNRLTLYTSIGIAIFVIFKNIFLFSVIRFRASFINDCVALTTTALFGSA
jgi:hypothetical protein